VPEIARHETENGALFNTGILYLKVVGISGFHSIKYEDDCLLGCRATEVMTHHLLNEGSKYL
jgi:hypothetical protein